MTGCSKTEHGLKVWVVVKTEKKLLEYHKWSETHVSKRNREMDGARREKLK